MPSIGQTKYTRAHSCNAQRHRKKRFFFKSTNYAIGNSRRGGKKKSIKFNPPTDSMQQKKWDIYSIANVWFNTDNPWELPQKLNGIHPHSVTTEAMQQRGWPTVRRLLLVHLGQAEATASHQTRHHHVSPGNFVLHDSYYF